MKKGQSILALTLVALLGFSCADENEESGGNNGVLTNEEATISLNSMSDEMHTDITEMVQSEGAESLTDLVDLLAGDDIFSGRLDTDASSAQTIKRRLSNIKRVFIPNSITDPTSDRFDFEGSLGIYNYNPETKTFDKTDDLVNNIQINFPTEGSSVNNATLRILEYADQVIVTDGFEEYLPTSIVADLTLNETVVVSLGLAASFSSDGTPKTADVSLFVNPFDYELIFSNTDDLSSSASFSVGKGSESIIGTSVVVTFKTQAKEEIITLAGEISYRTFALKGSVDTAGLAGVDENSSIDINDFIDLALYEGENKVGDVLIEDTADGEQVYLVYSDGTKELLETVLKPVLDEVENFLTQLEGS